MGETHENVCLLAAKHVKAARSQKLLSKMKIDAADATISAETPKRTITLVIDYCQNLDLPHLGGEQPGDTYYYSPVWIYCLGIVNTSEDKLYAYVYKELDKKKVGIMSHQYFCTMLLPTSLMIFVMLRISKS